MSLQTRMKTMALARAREKVAAEPPSGDACQRRSKRRESTLPAMLTFQNLRMTLPCTIADMSAAGAKLAFPATVVAQFGDIADLPERCTLVLKADRVQMDVQVMWRRAGKVGVKFLTPPKPIGTAKR